MTLKLNPINMIQHTSLWARLSKLRKQTVLIINEFEPVVLGKERVVISGNQNHIGRNG